MKIMLRELGRNFVPPTITLLAANLEAVKMLGLKLPTDPRWVNVAEKTIEEILTDHAFCEQKAATMGVTLIVKFSDHERLVDEVTPW